jgi:hypothetical protein
MGKVITPVLGGAAGFIAARYAGNMAATKDWGTTDPRKAKTAAAAIGIPAVFALSRTTPMLARHSGALVLGMGLAAAESWLRDTPLLGGSRAAAAVIEDLPLPVDDVLPGTAPLVDEPGEQTIVEGDGLSSYYGYATNADGQALSDDYYTASMLGSTADPSNQSAVEASLDSMEANGGDVPAISTIDPTGLALRARRWPQTAPVRERFANGDRGQAGGLFARNLFSGMTGS